MAELLKGSTCNSGETGSSPGWGKSTGRKKEVTIHSNILVQEIPWLEETRGPWGHKKQDMIVTKKQNNKYKLPCEDKLTII